MQLELHYSEKPHYSVAAAFIKGASADDWFSVIRQWDLSERELACYVVPQSIQSINAAGLFVVFKNNKIPKIETIVHPYGCVAGSLYIPVNSILFPAVQEEELKRILLWEIQLFHPSIGLIGFEESDKIRWDELLEYPLVEPVEWGFAREGVSANAPLMNVAIQTPPVNEMMESLKDDIGTKPIEDIPKDETQEESTKLSRALDDVKNSLLKGALFLTGAFISAIVRASSGSGNGNHSDQPGLLNRLENWLTTQIKDLDQKRDSELKRLLTMFDKDTDEALKYAIPLDSPYLQRGKPATPSASLSKRDTTFNLGGLGGGWRVDAWNVDNYYHDLRAKYQAAAVKEIEARRFKKAAYIYAHLLGDFHSAAKALEEGNHFHEAAALYKEHLKNIPAAAECYERGGLYTESIQLYTELERYEKVGDLYQLIEQTEQSKKFYNKTIENSLQSGNSIEAARVASGKLNDSKYAQRILLEGWHGARQSENCLNKYFEEVNRSDSENLKEHLKNVYHNETPVNRKMMFLNVLEKVVNTYKTPDLKQTSQEIAFEIISQQTVDGNNTALHFLKKFAPEDQLIVSDSLRYISNKKLTHKKVERSLVFELAPDIVCMKAATYKDQIIILGRTASLPVLIRGAWDGHFEYNAWSRPNIGLIFYSLVMDPSGSGNMIAYCGELVELPVTTLFSTGHFSAQVSVGSPGWLPPNLRGLCFNATGGVSAITTDNNIIKIHQYTNTGKLIKTSDCKITTQDPGFVLDIRFYRELYYKESIYYTYSDFFLVKLLGDGTASLFSVGAAIRKFILAEADNLLMAVSTDEGLLLVRQHLWDLKITTDFFGKTLSPFSMKFISVNILIVAERNKIVVFNIDENTPVVLKEFETENSIVEILAADKRNRFAVLTEDRKLSLYEL